MNKKGAIVIDMPTTCFECRFCHEKLHDNYYDYRFCDIEDMEVNEYCELRSKPDWCPLIEIKHSEEFNNLMDEL